VAAFSILVLSAIAIPAIFNISQADVFAFPKTVLTVAMAAVLVVVMGVCWLASPARFAVLRSGLAAALGAFLAWSLLAWWFAVDRLHALVGEQLQFQGLAVTGAYAVFMVTAWATVRTPRRRLLFLLAVAIGGTLVALYAVAQRAGLDPIWPALPRDRVFSTIGQANALAAYLVLTIPLAVALGGRSRPGPLAVAGVVVVMLAALAFTLSRGGYLGLATTALAMGAAIALWRRPLVTRRHMRIAVLIGLVAFGSILAIPGARATAERVAQRALLTADLSESSTQIKLDLWAVGMAIAADHPVVGVGLDNYVLVFDDYRDQLSVGRAEQMARFRPESPHNVYLGWAVGAGLPALAAYLTIVAIVVRRLIIGLRVIQEPRAWLLAAAVFAAVSGHLVTDLFMTAETTGSLLFWTILGVGAALFETSAKPRDSAMSTASW
jgi:O-antigen ligase